MFDGLVSAYEWIYMLNIFRPLGIIVSGTLRLILAAFALLLIRAVLLSYKIITSKHVLSKSSPFRIIICVGSGGHTAEMLTLLKFVNTSKYRPRLYIMAENDINSSTKIHLLERGSREYNIAKIPRSREVNQSYFSSVLSTLHSFIYTVPIVYKFKPDAIVCNGPGTCIPVCFIAFLLRCLFLSKCKTIFVESICRVKSLSLTGKILQFIADSFIVQWPELKEECLRAEYYGRLT